jgi:hypothetical protein
MARVRTGTILDVYGLSVPANYGWKKRWEGNMMTPE